VIVYGCDNLPVVGKHLGVNTRLLAEIYCSLRYVFRYKIVVTTPQPPYGGSHKKTDTGNNSLKTLTTTLYSKSYVLPDYGLLLAVRTELPTYDVHAYDVQTVLRTGSTTIGLRTVVLST
jgi:hypothetical protein